MATEPDLVIRASSLPTLLDCPARFKATQMEGKSCPSQGATVIGTSTHAGTAHFDSARLRGEKPLVTEAVQIAVESVSNAKEDVLWDDMKPSDAKDMAAKLTMKYCNDIAPKFEYDRVEQTLKNYDVEATNGVIFRFTGTLDRRYIGPNNGRGIVDLKSGQRVVKSDGTVNTQVSGAQLALYELLDIMATRSALKDEVVYPITLPAKIIALPTAGKHPPAVGEINNPHQVLIGTPERKGAIEIAAIMFKNDAFWGNARSMLCTKRYCPEFNKCWWRFNQDE